MSLRIFLPAALLFLSCFTLTNRVNAQSFRDSAVSKELYDTIVYLDSVLFEAYNTCKLDKFAELFSENIEFYHDKGGLTTSKKAIIEATKNNICGKVTRELVKGSIEVYPIPGYGAVQIGAHRFHNRQENSVSRIGKFVHTWKRENGEWKLTRVISLH